MKAEKGKRTCSISIVFTGGNEIISILENMVDIGIQIPSFLLPLVKNIKSQTEHFAGSDQKESGDK